MLPPPVKKIDLDEDLIVSPRLVGPAGAAVPQLLRAAKEENRKRRREDGRQASVDQTEDGSVGCRKSLNPFTRPRSYLFVLTCVYVFWYAGAFFGYGPMQLMLERQGAFSHLCGDNYGVDDGTDGSTAATTTCPEQNAMLLNVQLVAQLTMIASPFLGAWCDRNGPAEVAGGLFVSGALGILLLAIATSNLSIDWLLFPSFLCSGLMAQIAGLMTVQTGLIFTNPRTRNRVISSLNALYDAGAITYLILWYIDTHTVLTLPRIAAINLALFIFVVGSAIKCWFIVSPDKRGDSAVEESVVQDDEEECSHSDDNVRAGKTNTCIAKPKDFYGDDALGRSNRETKSDQTHKRVSWQDEIDASGSDDDVIDADEGEACLDAACGVSNSSEAAGDLSMDSTQDDVPKEPLSALQIAENSASSLIFEEDGGQGQQAPKVTVNPSIDPTTPARRRSSTASIASMLQAVRRTSMGRKHGKKTSITFGDSDDDDSFHDTPTEPQSPPYILISNRPALDQLRSRQFLTLTAFFAFHHSRNTWTLTTTRDFLAYLGDDETGNKYLAIFTLLTPASVLGLPFVDKIVQKGGYAAGLHVVNALAIGQGVIQVSSDNLNVQVIGFVLYSFYRCFLFSVCFSCLPVFLSVIVLGKGYGLLIFSGGVCSLMNIPLANAAVQQLDGNFFVPNLIYTVLCLPCILLVWIIHRGFQREDRAKEIEETTGNGDDDLEEDGVCTG